MTLNEATNLNEELALIKFKYDAEGRHDRKPRVIVIDPHYPGKVGQSTYGLRDDILGINLNYSDRKERKKIRAALSSIDLFSDFLNCGMKERYDRLKDFAPPKYLKYIRRYNRAHISHAKIKRGFFYHKTFLTGKDDYFKNNNDGD